jgi:Ni/Co efflux regulator RcnB
MTIARGQTAGQMEKKTWEEKKQSAHSKRGRSWRQERKEKKIIHPHCKRESLERKKKKKNCSPVAKEKEVGRKITNCSSYFFQEVSRRFVGEYVSTW